MTENKIDSNSLNFGENADDMSSEESLQETSIEEDRQTEYLDEEEPPSNAVDLGEDMPKRRNWFDRCGDCEGVPEDQVCGSDGKTYENSCELEYFSCRRYWAITEVAKGPCETPCPGVTLGKFSGFGYYHATNKGLCHHDFFRCLKISRTEGGFDARQAKDCCQARFDQCAAFVSERPWRAGILKYGKK